MILSLIFKYHYVSLRAFFAKQSLIDCFVASLLAMTIKKLHHYMYFNPLFKL